MMKNIRIAIIGCGNLGQAILKGLIDDHTYPTENITATKRHIEVLEPFQNEGVIITSDNAEAVRKSDLIIVALKPHNILHILEELSPDLNPDKHILVSLATGISTAQIEEAIGKKLPIFRAMPNTGADVNESLTCLCSVHDNETSVSQVEYFFNLIGKTITIDEDLMEAATVLGACGIAFVMRFMRAMVQGGIQIGFDAKTANIIVNQTVKGASQLLIERKQHPEFEIDKVTTPKGCTIAGLNEMEHHGFSSALIRGIVTSFEKI
ncbi:MAG: pyrroline-5-carboxylate reductase [Flavobacteriaceae bacterium]|nr:pyrroline-5-carboxylate reductase [Flavobacteriaceae bacterium]NNL79748.1 pyrroline-5-carboxylate reductase [Flavobacteriaceae bacterium]